MPIKSYLAHPQEGKKEELVKAIANLKYCEVLPAENKEVLVLVTETQTESQDILLKEKLDAIDSLKLLVLVSGFNSPKNN
jgi:nitrate reductase NapAB chaperone NapD